MIATFCCLSQIDYKQLTKIASNGQFSHSLSIDGNYAVIGNFTDDTDALGNNTLTAAGAAFIYERDTNTNQWQQVQKIVAGDRTFAGNFGYSVSIDGDIILVSCRNNPRDAALMNFVQDAGAAYIFERNSTTGVWSQIQKIAASDRTIFAKFGSSVSISGDKLIVGAFELNSQTGAAYIFEYNSGTNLWQQSHKLVASDASTGDRFGYSVSISGDYAVIGAYNEDHDALGGNQLVDAGSVYLFEYNSGSGQWIENKIVPNDRSAYDEFGGSVSIDGDRAIFGANGDDFSSIANAGSAYIYERNNSSGTWELADKIVASDAQPYDRFGGSVSIDGDRAISGALFEDHDVLGNNELLQAGSAYIYEYNNTNDQWVQADKIVANDRSASSIFGRSVDISGHFSVIGANINNNGAAYIFWPPPPPTHPSSFFVEGAGKNTLSLSFSSPASTSNDGYLVLYRTGTVLTDLPTDNTTYNVGNTIGQSTVGGIITDNQATTFTLSGLAMQTGYTVRLVPFIGSGATSDYFTTGTPATLTTSTIPTMGQWAMYGFIALMGLGGFWAVRRRLV